MRLLLALCLGLCLIALQVVLGARAFYPEAFATKPDVVDPLAQKIKSVQDQLSPEELSWLVQHPVVIVGVDPNFYPLEMFDERGRYSGLGGDYLHLLSKSTGIDFRVRRLPDWASTEREAREKRVDLFMAAAKTGRREEYMLFTRPYINMPGVIMTRRQAGLDNVNMEDLRGKKVAVVENYSWHDFLKEFHPEVVAVPVRDTLDALQRVVTGEVDAVVDYEFNLIEKIQAGGIMQMQTAGKVASSYGHSIAVRSDWPQLLSVVNKGMAQLSPEEHWRLASSWIQRTARPAGQERHIQWIFFFVAESIVLCLLLFWFWQNDVSKQVALRTRELEEKLAAAQKA